MDYQTIANRLDQENDARFQHNVDTAVETLSNILGYSLLPLDETETRVYPVEEYAVWQRVDPFYELTAVRINDGSTSTPITNYKVGQNGAYNQTWYNGVRLCGCEALCHCRISLCATFELQAKFGFKANTVSGTDSFTNLPADLMAVLDAMVTESYDELKNIKSESRGTRSYTKFDNKSVVDEFATTIKRYKRDW